MGKQILIDYTEDEDWILAVRAARTAIFEQLADGEDSLVTFESGKAYIVFCRGDVYEAKVAKRAKRAPRRVPSSGDN